MLRVKDSKTIHSQFGAFTVLVFYAVVFLALMHSCRGQSEVIGPSQPIVAKVGEDIILPCYLDPVMNAFDMTVEWARPDLEPRFVLLWREGVELQSEKHPSYEGRTSLSVSKLKLGDVSLKLSRVKISDEGRYKCFIPALSRAPTVQLVVGAVSSPVILMTKTSSAVVLQCESTGWYREPELFWLDGEGNHLSAGPTETLRGPDDLYTVSSRVTVEERHGNNFTCRVQQKNINQTRETHVHVPDHFFMVPRTPGSLHVIIGSAVGCAALVSIPAVVFVVWKWRQNKFKNKKKGPEDGTEQTKDEETVLCKTENTGSQVMMEGGQSVPLMAGREEENNVQSRGEEKIEPQNEHKDLQFVAESETHHQLGRNPDLTRDVDRTEGERVMKSVNDEKVPLISTEVETYQKQDMIGRQVKNDQDKAEGEQTMKAVKEDSGLLTVLVAEGQNEQPQNLHTDQEVQKEEETRQETMSDVDKKGNQQEQVKKGGSGSTGQKKQQDNQRGKNKRMFLPEIQKRKEREKDKIELKPQKENGNQRLLEDRKQKGSKTREDTKDHEGSQSNMTRTAEGKAENQNEETKKTEEEKVENEKVLQSERQETIKRDKERVEPKTETDDGNSHVLDASKQEAEHEDKKGKDQEGNQRDMVTETERKAENHKGQRNEQVERTEEESEGRENNPLSLGREVTESPKLKTHQAERKKQELQEETSQRNQEETKVQPERSTEGVKVECKERQGERLETDKVADTDETLKKSKKIEKNSEEEKREDSCMQQQLDVKEETREPPQVLQFTAERAESQKVGQKKVVSINRRRQRNVKREKLKEEFHVEKQPPVRKRKPQEEETVQTETTVKKPKECVEEQNDVEMVEMDDEEESNTEQIVIDEPQGGDRNSQLDQATMCQDDQQEAPMDVEVTADSRKSKKKKVI